MVTLAEVQTDPDTMSKLVTSGHARDNVPRRFQPAGPSGGNDHADAAERRRARRRVRHRPKRSQIRDLLQEMILRGELEPGTRLQQHKLAARFGVTHGVVREALLELRVHGLVESSDRLGTYVARLDTNSFIEAMVVREAHEALAVRLCCDFATRVQVRELMELAERIHQLGAASDWSEMDALDRQLHLRLVQLSGNRVLLRLVDSARLVGRSVGVRRDPAVVLDEHLSILKAIHDGQPNDAERLMRRHLAATREAMGEQLEAAAAG